MKRMKSAVFLLACVLLMLAACNEDNADSQNDVQASETGETITLKFATAQSETHSLTAEVFKPFMEKVTELTDGQVQFEFYPAEQLGKFADLMDLTRDGVADISFFISTYYPSQMPITSALIGIPGLYSTSHEGTMAYHELSKQDPVLETDFLRNGVRPLFSYDAPPGELWTTGKEIKVPEDLKGMKVRVTGEVLNRATVALDASPINISLSELYEGFDRGVFNVLNLNPQSTKDHGLGEIIKFGTVGIDFGGSGTGLIINEKVFLGLPENVQEILVQVGDELTESNAIRTDEYVQNIIEDFKDQGIQMYELSEEEKAQWQKFYSEVEAKWVKEQSNPDIEKTLDDFKEAIKNYN